MVVMMVCFLIKLLANACQLPTICFSVFFFYVRYFSIERVFLVFFLKKNFWQMLASCLPFGFLFSSFTLDILAWLMSDEVGISKK
jgi:hypothetical protein